MHVVCTVGPSGLQQISFLHGAEGGKGSVVAGGFAVCPHGRSVCIFSTLLDEVPKKFYAPEYFSQNKSRKQRYCNGLSINQSVGCRLWVTGGGGEVFKRNCISKGSFKAL